MVAGTQGYEKSVRPFLEATRRLSFDVVCKDFIDFLPSAPTRILDAGAGIGQNAAALAKMGHTVVAVEPLQAFLTSAQAAYSHLPITWLQDSLPLIEKISAEENPFGFILVEAVWHHLNEDERACALSRLCRILGRNGSCAISLRNGPPGLGTHVFPTDATATVQQAQRLGLNCVLCRENLPSILPNKETVTWSRLVLQKR
ncbi:MAG: class I SAM-dependent methyltransferase [Pseudomonadota bacterium]